MQTSRLICCALFSIFLSLSSYAQEARGATYEVTITNISKSQIFSPPLLISHTAAVKPFEVGMAASAGLKLMAEDGDASLLLEELAPSNETFDLQIADGPVLPGQSITVDLEASGRFDQVTVLGMLVTTNDTFFSASTTAPRSLQDLFKRAAPKYFTNVGQGNAYDAGTEFNSEDCAHIPGPPCGNPGATPDEASEGYIYIANGIHGKADLDASTYDYNNPVVQIKVRRK
ncbi:MAG: spondin domain-containing protein [Acidobacteriota bacterium]|nr:spondin domain-containing protein [Acidobacteriota bacterium]